jgi:hypothetical protein
VGHEKIGFFACLSIWLFRRQRFEMKEKERMSSHSIYLLDSNALRAYMHAVSASSLLEAPRRFRPAGFCF